MSSVLRPPRRPSALLGAFTVALVSLALLASPTGAHAARPSVDRWSGWQDVPGGGRTQSMPAAVMDDRMSGGGGFRDQHVFVRGTNNAIYVNRANVSGNWTGWAELPWGGRTESAPAAVSPCYQQDCPNDLDGLWVAVRSLGNGVMMSHRDWFSRWTNWQEISGSARTNVPPDLVRYGNWMYVFVRALDGRIIFNRIQEANQGWAGWTEVPGAGRTPSAVSAAVYGDVLSVFIRGTNDTIYVNRLGPDGAWTGWIRVAGMLTLSAPAAHRYGNSMYLIVRGTDNGIYVNRRDARPVWTGWYQLADGLTPSGPAVDIGYHGLTVFIRGTNDSIYQNVLIQSSTAR
jgi:hypothetical protein